MKVLKIVVYSILGVVMVGISVLYVVNPELALEILEQAKDILNQPLPIVGVTTGAVLLFSYNIFQESKFGKKSIAQLERVYAEKTKLLDEKVASVEQIVSNQDKKIALNEKSLKTAVIRLCELSTNQKIKNLGKELEDVITRETED